MKYIFILLAFTLFSTISKASNKDPIFKIILSKGYITKVVIDDIEKLVNLEREFFTDTLPTGFHSIKVYAKNKKNSSCKGKLIYENNIGVRKGFNTLILITNNNTGKVITNPIIGYKFNEQIEGGTYDDTRSQPINGRAFADLKTAVSETLDEQKKGLLVKSAIENNFFLTSQEIPLLALVAPVYWLELAEMFYIVTLDRENFSEILNFLNSNSDREKLKAFIENY